MLECRRLRPVSSDTTRQNRVSIQRAAVLGLDKNGKNGRRRRRLSAAAVLAIPADRAVDRVGQRDLRREAELLARAGDVGDLAGLAGGLGGVPGDGVLMAGR